MQFDKGCESGADLAFDTGLQDRELHRLCTRHILHVSNDALGTWTVRVHEQGDHLGVGNQLGKQLEPLGRKPVRLPPGRARVATSPAPTGSAATKTIGIVEVAFFAANAEEAPPLVAITSTLRLTRSAANAGSRS